MGAVVAALQGTSLDTKIDLESINKLNDYWINVREIYAPFESGQKSAGADVYIHEMPGGQYTNLLFQAQSLGLGSEWTKIKQSYAEANKILGNIIKVTPSSKVVGDLAQFMVQNNLSGEQVVEKAEKLSFPSSVVEYFQGYLGHPVGGFPEPLRARVLKGKPSVEGRPGASLPPLDFEKILSDLKKKYNEFSIRDVDAVSWAMYPKVFEEYKEFRKENSDVSVLPTRQFIHGLDVGEEASVELERGKTLFLKLKAIGDLDKNGEREVYFDLNGLPRTIKVSDKSVAKTKVVREKAVPGLASSIGAPMPGVVIGVKVKEGDQVKVGQSLVVLSAMKMETVVGATANGIVKRVCVKLNDVKGGDLLFEIEEKKK